MPTSPLRTPFCRRRQASSALVIVLFAILLATIMILALMTGAKLEQRSAFYYLERMRADTLAQSGIDHAIGLLRSGMGGTNQSWISGPGYMVTVTYNSNAAPTYGTPIALSSGTNSNGSGIYALPNLNSPLFDGTYPIDGEGAAMPVQWIYVHRDGTLDSLPVTNNANPLIGRYAFWIDDSSARINLNTAWTRGASNTNGLGSVSRIDLDAVTNFPTSQVRSNSTAAYFNSDYDLRNAASLSAVASNRFAYTFYNHSSDGLNPFGKPKIYLTTQQSNLPTGLVPSGTNYLNILASPNGDPGVASNLSDANISATVNNLYSYLTNSNWPEYPGTSFAKKYWGSNTDPRIFQLAVNIVEYVRAKESPQKILPAIRGYVTGDVFYSTTESSSLVAWAASPSGKAMPLIGVTRTPLITEAGIFYWSSAAGFVFQTEIYLPPHIGIDSVAGTDITMQRKYWVTNSPSDSYEDGWYPITYSRSASNPSSLSDGKFYDISPGFPLLPGKYVQLQAEQREAKATNGPFQVYDWTVIAPVSQASAVSWGAPLNWGATAWGAPTDITTGVGPFQVATNNTGPLGTSLQVNDPLLGCLATNWQSAASSWGTTNMISTVGGTPGAFSPQQDTDGNGKLTDLGWRLPYPAPSGYTPSATSTNGVPNPTGRVESLAELGYVDTGMVCWTNSGAAGANGVPWRTLRLQPTSTATLPDWALLDLFAVPPAPSPSGYVYQPYGWTSTANTFSAIGGRLNLNGQLYPFTNLRTAPLAALLYGSTNIDTNSANTNPATLVTNILQMQLASNPALGVTGRLYDSVTNSAGSPGYYAHIGELAEIKGMADAGEASEGNLFEPLAQSTLSGNVFTIYTIGQALQQSPSGSFQVNGEKRYQATLERIPTVAASSTGTGLFRVVVIRQLSP